jgi:hypothetical protein
VDQFAASEAASSQGKITRFSKAFSVRLAAKDFMVKFSRVAGS